MNKSKKAEEPTIRLAFLAELIALFLGNGHLFSGVRSNGDVLMRFNEIVTNPDEYMAGVDRVESRMSQAIDVASWLGAVAPVFSDLPAEKRIHLTYMILRVVFFEVPWPLNPRFDPLQTKPAPEQNRVLMEMAFKMLQGVECVREAVEAQRAAGTLTRWKIEQQRKAINVYHKLRTKILRKADELRTYLSAKLLEAPDNPVNISEKNSGAQNADILAPDGTFGARKAENPAPATRTKEKRKNPGV